MYAWATNDDNDDENDDDENNDNNKELTKINKIPLPAAAVSVVCGEGIYTCLTGIYYYFCYYYFIITLYL